MMTYTVTHENLNQDQFMNWLNKAPRYTIPNSNGIESHRDTLPDGLIHIMVVGRGSRSTAIHHHVIMRYKYTHISFYPSCTTKPPFANNLDGEFKVSNEGIEFSDSDPFYKFFRLNINADNNEERSQITSKLNRYFGVSTNLQNDDATSTTQDGLQWTIPNVENVKWNFESMIFTLRGIGCLVKKIDCTNVVVDALRTAGLTTPLNTKPALLRIAPNTLSALCLLYLIVHATKYAVASHEYGVTAAITGSFELLACIIYTITVYSQPILSMRQRQALPKLLRDTNASSMLVIMSMIFLAMDIFVDAANGKKIEIIPSRRDGIVLSNMRLTIAITILPFATRCLLFLETVFTAIQNNPLNPVELAQFLEHVASMPADGNRPQEQNGIVPRSFESPFNGAYMTSHKAYLVDAAKGINRLLGGHAFLVIEGVDDNKYIIERIEITAQQQKLIPPILPLNILKSALYFLGIFSHKPTVSAPDGFVSNIICHSVIANIENGNLLIDDEVKEKLKSWNSQNYETYNLDSDQFKSLRRSFRIEQIKFAHAHAEAISLIQTNEELRSQFSSCFSAAQQDFIRENNPLYYFPQMTQHVNFYYYVERFRTDLACDANDLESIGFDSLNQKHFLARQYLIYVNNEVFKSQNGADSINSTGKSVFFHMFKKLQNMRGEDNQCLLPDGVLRFSISGPGSGFRGNSGPGKPNNCLSWAKSLLQNVGIEVVSHNKPKLIRSPR